MALRKRTRQPRKRATTLAKRSFKPRNNLGAKSLLLDLPAELRNEVYYYVAASTAKVIIHKGILVPHPLAQVSRQTQQEFLPIFRSDGIPQATAIKAHVLNFDFRPVVTFLNKFVIRKGTNGIQPRHNLDITITIAGPCEHKVDYVRRWLNRCNTNRDMAPFTRKYSAHLDWNAPSGEISTYTYGLLAGARIDLQQQDARDLQTAITEAVHAAAGLRPIRSFGPFSK